MLEVWLYYDYFATGLGDAVVDLIDWAVRRVADLIHRSHAAAAGELTDSEDSDDDGPGPIPDDPEERLAYARARAAAMAAKAQREASSGASLRRQGRTMRFNTGIAAVTILRYLAEHVSKLPLAAASRMLDTHDLPLACVALIENPPWTRRHAGKWEKFIQRQWTPVVPRDLLKLTPTEGQPWLTMYNLLCDKECRAKYELPSWRRNTLARVRKYLNDVLVDQLPPLADLQRFLDEMQVAAAPPGVSAASAARGGVLVLELQPELHDAVLEEALSAADARVKDADLRDSRLSAQPAPADGDESSAADAATAASWKKVAVLLLQRGFARKDAGDPVLMEIASVFAGSEPAEAAQPARAAARAVSSSPLITELP